jgi:hypothetical protein
MKSRQIDILKQPIPTLLATFALLLTWQTLRAVRLPYPAENLSGALSPVGAWIDSTLGGIASTIVVLIAVLISSLIITRIISRYSLSVIRSLVPMVLFSICVCGVVLPIGSPALVLSILMIVHATELMIMSFKRTERFSEVMRAAFWTGLAALIIPDLIYVALLLPIQWFIWQRSPREMVAGVIMFFLPLLPASYLWWLGGQEFGWLTREWFSTLSPITPIDLAEFYGSIGGLMTTTLFGILTLLTLASIVVFVGSFGSMRIRARKGHLYFALLYIVGAAMLLLGVPVAVAMATMGFASVPLIHTFFVRREGTVSAIIYIVVLLATLLTAIYPQLAA